MERLKQYINISLISIFAMAGIPYIEHAHSDTGNEIDVFNVIHREHYILRLRIFKKYPIKINSVVFLGDSLTERCCWMDVIGLKDIVNCGIDGDTTAGIMNRLSHIISLHPRSLFLQAGVNDLLLGSTVEKTVSRYHGILKCLKKSIPAKNIYIQSLLPTTSVTLNERIKILNLHLKRISRSQGYNFVDIYPVLEGGDGLIKKEYTYDGLHLTEKGYVVWSNKIKSLVK